MLNEDVFKDAAIKEEDHDLALQKEREEHRGNPIPKRVVSLEKLFDLQNRFRGPPNTKVQISTLLHQQINVRTETEPRFVNLGTKCTPHGRQYFTKLFKKYKDVFT